MAHAELITSAPINPDPPGQNRPRRRWWLNVVAAALTIHAGMLSWMAYRDSPTWDEVAHFPAGLSHWYTGNFDLYRVNPPLVRLVAMAPLALWNVPFDDAHWFLYDGDPMDRGEFRAGRSTAIANGRQYFWRMTVARWACIPFSLIGAAVCFAWARALYGVASGLMALALWVFCPNVLAHGHLITPDAGAAAIGVAACFAFWRWLAMPTAARAFIAGVALGLAQLTKFTWIILFAVWPALWLMHLWLKKAAPAAGDGPGAAVRLDARWRRGTVGLVAMMVLAVVTINVGYGFEASFKRLGDQSYASQFLGGGEPLRRDRDKVRNRFADTPAAGIRVPVPANYLRGIDFSKWEFEEKKWSYLRGEWRLGGWWYYYLYALLIKVPLGTWAIVALAVIVTCFARGYSARAVDELVLLLPGAVLLVLVSSQTGFNHHLRYVLPAFPFAFIWASKVARAFALRHRPVAITAGVAIGWSILSSLSTFPHSLSYFNELVGGPKNGHFHLGTSNTDWGQDLLYLRQWLDRHPDAEPLYLAYDLPLIDPRTVGIQYEEPPAQSQTRPGWYAISVNRFHSRENALSHFRSLTPSATAGYSIWIYHVTPDVAEQLRSRAL